MVYVVTGVTLAGYSIFQKGIVDVDRILAFWLQLTPLIIAVFLAKWIYEDAQNRSIPSANIWSFGGLFAGLIALPMYLFFRRSYPLKKGSASSGNHKKEIDKGFKKVVFVYIVISLAVGLMSVLTLFIIFAKKTGQPINPLEWVRTYVQEDQAYKKSFENNPPPEVLSIGGMGLQSNFVFVKSLDGVPDEYRFERKDLRGFRIYVQKSGNLVQIARPEQYARAVVENVGHWISLYEVETDAK